MYAIIAKEYNITTSITHRFLKKGKGTPKRRGILFSIIERAAECERIYTLDEWKFLYVGLN